MKRCIFAAIIITLFNACVPKDIDQDPLKNELLAYTAKFEDVQNKFLVLGTYLNPIHQNSANLDPQKEYFVLCVYPKDANLILQSFKLNSDTNGTKIEILPENDKILELTTFKIPWGRYLKITAPSKDTQMLTLTFEREINGTSQAHQVSLNFRKIAKSLYWNAKGTSK